jgi:hypothetical protein
MCLYNKEKKMFKGLCHVIVVCCSTSFSSSSSSSSFSDAINNVSIVVNKNLDGFYEQIIKR